MSTTGKVVAGVAALAVVAGAAAFATGRRFDHGASASDAIDNTTPTSESTIARRTLSSQTNVDATLGYAANYDLVNQAHGTITTLPAVGDVVTRGQVLYRVDGSPVILLYGSTPAYRSLAEGAAASDVSGPDVQELNANLVALGLATRSEIDPTSDEFGSATKVALEKLQAFLGLAKDGTLPLGGVVFLPSAARITAVADAVTLGGTAPPGATILKATSPTRLVTIALDASQQAEMKTGDAVTVTLPDHRTTPGVVWSVGTVATAGSPASAGAPASAPTIEVDIVLTDPGATGTLDQAPVTVAITTATVKNALAVPVNALLALASGGYAVEVIGATGGRQTLVVALGLFDDADGLVQVSGAGVAAGQRVVVPAS